MVSVIFCFKCGTTFNHSHQLKMQISVTAEVVNLRNTLAIYGNMNCVLTSESVDVEQFMQPVRSSLPAAVIALQHFTESLTCRTDLFCVNQARKGQREIVSHSTPASCLARRKTGKK